MTEYIQIGQSFPSWQLGKLEEVLDPLSPCQAGR